MSSSPAPDAAGSTGTKTAWLRSPKERAIGDALVGAGGHVVGLAAGLEIVGGHRAAHGEQELDRRRIDRSLNGSVVIGRVSLCCAAPSPPASGTLIRMPSKDVQEHLLKFGYARPKQENRHALHRRTQAGNPDAHHQERPPPVQPQRLRRCHHRRDHGARPASPMAASTSTSPPRRTSTRTPSWSSSAPTGPSPGRRATSIPRRKGAALARMIVDAYLSTEHFDDRDGSCPMIALPSDVVARQRRGEARLPPGARDDGRRLRRQPPRRASARRASGRWRSSQWWSAAWCWRAPSTTRPWPTSSATARAGRSSRRRLGRDERRRRWLGHVIASDASREPDDRRSKPKSPRRRGRGRPLRGARRRNGGTRRTDAPAPPAEPDPARLYQRPDRAAFRPRHQGRRTR